MAAEAVVLGEGVDLVDEVLAVLVGGVGLAGEDDLDRPPRIVHQPLEAFQVTEQERRAFVGGEASGEPDRQGFRVEQRTGGQNLRRIHLALDPAKPRLLVDVPQ